MSFIPGMFPAPIAAARTPASVTYIGNTSSAAAQNHTLNDVAIGAIDTTRRLIIAVQLVNSVAHRTISSITMDGGGIGAQLVSVSSSDGFIGGDIFFYSVLAPTGTTADFQINTSGTNTLLRLTIFRAINEILTSPHDTMTDNTGSSGDVSATIDIPNNGWVVAIANCGGVSVTSVNWSGATEQFESTGFNPIQTGALQSLLPTQSGRTITATTVGGSDYQGAMAGVSWG